MKTILKGKTQRDIEESIQNFDEKGLAKNFLIRLGKNDIASLKILIKYIDDDIIKEIYNLNNFKGFLHDTTIEVNREINRNLFLEKITTLSIKAQDVDLFKQIIKSFSVEYFLIVRLIHRVTYDLYADKYFYKHISFIKTLTEYDIINEKDLPVEIVRFS